MIDLPEFQFIAYMLIFWIKSVQNNSRPNLVNLIWRRSTTAPVHFVCGWSPDSPVQHRVTVLKSFTLHHIFQESLMRLNYFR